MECGLLVGFANGSFIWSFWVTGINVLKKCGVFRKVQSVLGSLIFSFLVSMRGIWGANSETRISPQPKKSEKTSSSNLLAFSTHPNPPFPPYRKASDS